ncbi:LytR/AlgR family response regulator transcription factor [Clostridium hydrogenum]|uniref:LytR/AlgR family response regulator transcription factor n=1 Tax=Clostridium hydrogenum TaxID=2855764 RepID=UPI001F2B6E49|nr:LytTR family DNA-binding domain-containing protein [Clostridium hydrogenum]
MLNIAICDDEEIQRREIVAMLKNIISFDFMNLKIYEFKSGEELIFCSINFDVILLDIKLDNVNGIEVAKKIRDRNSKTNIIFITAYKDYVFDAFDVRAFNYILKPIDENRLKKIIKLALLEFREDKFIIAKTSSESIKISYNDIIYIESQGRKVKIHTTYDVIEYYYRISEIEKELSLSNFFRCHKSFIVNFMYVERYTSKYIILKNSEEIYISKYRLNDFSKAFMYYLKGEI